MVDILLRTLQNTFKLAEFRDPQRLICDLVLAKQDVLFIAPTGRGKSLCYQLPGVLLGTTVVISPLISLMDDQQSKINKLGLVAERLHSGMKDSDIARVTAAYIKGDINFLLIAPERLGTNFMEVLQNHPPALITVDESHMIVEASYRPDYRLLKERLPPGIPIIALTATATPKVQVEILEQLNIPNAKLVVSGFRRENIAISIQETPSKNRETKVVDYLKNPNTKPAIVFAGTRKQTESMAALLKKYGHKAESYHAGMTPKARTDVQERFMSGEIDIVAGTIAFSLGIDKSNIRTVLHLSMPGSVEAYYQEIGRAGRDGLPSKAVMLCNYEDKARQMWFIDKSYPSVEYLQMVFNVLTDEPQDSDVIQYKIPSIDKETIGTALGKLVTYGAALKSHQQYVKGPKPFRGPYLEARKYSINKLEAMYQYTQDKGCRMLGFLNYFGDTNDDYAPCNMCDSCLKKATKTPEALKAAVTAAAPKVATKAEGFAPGTYVSHTKYGIGKVEKSEPGSMGNRQATLRFSDGIRRVIMEKYLKEVTDKP